MGANQLQIRGCFRSARDYNTLAENALLQKLVPMYFVDMQRSAGTQNMEGWSPQSRVYNAVYERHSTPDRFMVVTIERFPKGQNALEHFNDITHAIPDDNPNRRHRGRGSSRSENQTDSVQAKSTGVLGQPESSRSDHVHHALVL